MNLCVSMCVCVWPTLKWDRNLWKYDEGSCERRRPAIIVLLKWRPCIVIHTLDAVRWNHVVGGTSPLAYTWGCVMTRPAQLQRRVLGYKRKHLKRHLSITVLKKASAACFGGFFLAQAKNGQVLSMQWVQWSRKGQSGWHCLFKALKSIMDLTASWTNGISFLSQWCSLNIKFISSEDSL